MDETLRCDLQLQDAKMSKLLRNLDKNATRFNPSSKILNYSSKIVSSIYTLIITLLYEVYSMKCFGIFLLENKGLE